MKPALVLSLGNALAGDDGVAMAVTQAARTDHDIDHCADWRHAGSDLLRCTELMRGRARIIIVDAALGEPVPMVTVHLGVPVAEAAPRTAHALDPIAAMHLLRTLEPDIAASEVAWVLIHIPGIRLQATLSPAAAALVPIAARRLRALLTSPPIVAPG